MRRKAWIRADHVNDCALANQASIGARLLFIVGWGGDSSAAFMG